MNKYLKTVFVAWALRTVDAQVCTGGRDVTLISENKGSDVALACVHKITQSGVFGSDNSLLRRLAFVESRDGMDADTYQDGFHGGMWQLEESKFLATARASRRGLLAEEFRAIYQSFHIIWENTQWYDLRKPFYSALGARLYLSLVDTEIPYSFNISGQGLYWSDHYTRSNKSIDDFVSAVEEYTLCVQEGKRENDILYGPA